MFSFRIGLPLLTSHYTSHSAFHCDAVTVTGTGCCVLRAIDYFKRSSLCRIHSSSAGARPAPVNLLLVAVLNAQARRRRLAPRQCPALLRRPLPHLRPLAPPCSLCSRILRRCRRSGVACRERFGFSPEPFVALISQRPAPCLSSRILWLAQSGLIRTAAALQALAGAKAAAAEPLRTHAGIGT